MEMQEGYMRVVVWSIFIVFVVALVVTVVACGSHQQDRGGNGDGMLPDACSGPSCEAARCQAMAKPVTAVTGTVFAPNGTLPLYGINVYVPSSDPGPFPDGAQCTRCAGALPGNPIVATISDQA